MNALERRLKKAIAGHRLDRIELIITGHGFVARAYPHRHGEVVRNRIRDAYAKVGASITLKQAEEIAEKAAEGEQAHAVGDDMESAANALISQLNAPQTKVSPLRIDSTVKVI